MLGAVASTAVEGGGQLLGELEVRSFDDHEVRSVGGLER